MAQFKNQKRLLHNGPIGDLAIVEPADEDGGGSVDGLLFKPGNFMNAQTQLLIVTCTASVSTAELPGGDEPILMQVKLKIDDREIRVKPDGSAYHNNIVPPGQEAGPQARLSMCVNRSNAGARIAMPSVAIPVYLDGRDYHGRQRNFKLTLQPGEHCAIDEHDILNVTLVDHG